MLRSSFGLSGTSMGSPQERHATYQAGIGSTTFATAQHAKAGLPGQADRMLWGPCNLLVVTLM
jgi:hypothetical protein